MRQTVQFLKIICSIDLLGNENQVLTIEIIFSTGTKAIFTVEFTGYIVKNEITYSITNQHTHSILCYQWTIANFIMIFHFHHHNHQHHKSMLLSCASNRSNIFHLKASSSPDDWTVEIDLVL